MKCVAVNYHLNVLGVLFILWGACFRVSAGGDTAQWQTQSSILLPGTGGGDWSAFGNGQPTDSLARPIANMSLTLSSAGATSIFIALLWRKMKGEE
jgi:hypothetical protein